VYSEHDHARTTASPVDRVARGFGGRNNPGRGSNDCQRDETDAQSKLQQEWARYTSTQRANCARFAGLDRAPSYVELLTCLEMAKQAQELPEESKIGTSGSKVGTTGSRMGTSGRQ
jgi:hypothetical protein